MLQRLWRRIPSEYLYNCVGVHSFTISFSVQRQLLDLIEGWLRHKSDMVNLEAARVICEMKGVTAAQLTKPISGMLFLLNTLCSSTGRISDIDVTVLQLFLSSPKSTLRFAATRTLAALAVAHPASVATCNVDLENLISDSNRSVATYAITALLKVNWNS